MTGATSGIGEAFAHWYADSASELVLVGRNQSELDRVANAVRSRGVHTEVIVADLSHKDGVESVGARCGAIARGWRARPSRPVARGPQSVAPGCA